MKISTFFAGFVPELRRLTGAQLLKIWIACAPWSQNLIYLHLVLLLACCSLIFNLIIRVNASLPAMVFALVAGLSIPSNIYFFAVFNGRRAALRQYIDEHWEEFRPE